MLGRQELVLVLNSGSLSSNTESNPREQLNAITIQDEEGLVEHEPEPRKGIVVSKSKGEVNHSEQTLETHSNSTHELCSSNNKGPIYEERRLRVEELDEWRIHKLKTHDKPKPHHDELNISPNRLKVGDKVLLDAAGPRIATFEPNGEIPLTVLTIFPYGMRSVNSSHHHDHATEREKIFPNTGVDKLPRLYDMAVGEYVKTTRACDTPVLTTRDNMSSPRGKKTIIPASKKKKGTASSSGPIAKIRHPFLQFPSGPQEELFQILRARPQGVVITEFDDLKTVQSHLSGLVHQLSVLEFGIAPGLYMESSWMTMTLTASIATSTTLLRNAGKPSYLPQPPMILAAPRHQLSLHPYDTYTSSWSTL
ncbi:hypothetical protein GOBAR_AA29935 [Gossypium barbadense]|uniref:Uncharacterized protein n=1 Tax=Gossypium barbadense TaxID=3634 RepID=A0A2P5WI46_GOSBA|nr:hypothetical protein GOBAR_AA29935 [Gossypium barbadense]